MLLATGRHLPKPPALAFELLDGFAVPLMLLALGHMLAPLKLASIGRGVVLATFHLLMASATGFGPGLPACLVSSAPNVASLIMVSTLMTVVFLPIVMSYGL